MGSHMQLRPQERLGSSVITVICDGGVRVCVIYSRRCCWFIKVRHSLIVESMNSLIVFPYDSGE